MKNLFFICALILIGAAQSFAQAVGGSENLIPNPTHNPTLRNMGQSFTLDSDATVTSISIKRKNTPGTNTIRKGTLTIYDGAGLAGSVIQTATITMPAFTETDAAYKVETCVLDKPLLCKAGQIYTFNIDLPIDAVNKNALICILGKAPDAYKGGTAFYDKNAKNDTDFWFQLGIKEDCNFFWSTVPTISPDNNKVATGTINGISYTYSSSQPIEFTNGVHNHQHFPAEEKIPNTTSIKNTKITTNTIVFEKPITDPVLVFSSIGNYRENVPIKFEQDFKVAFNHGSTTKIDGKVVSASEGYIVLRFPGTHTTLNFEYTQAEDYCNFVFGAATCKPAAE